MAATAAEEEGKPDFEEQPAGIYARQILNRLLVDLSWNSSQLEGNTIPCWTRGA